MQLNRIRLNLMLVSVLPLIVGGLLAYLLMDAALVGEVLRSNTRNFSIGAIIIQSLVSTGLGTAIVFAIFYTIQKRGPGA